jgi:hypothetical protein
MIRGYDSSPLFRADTILRIRHLHAEANAAVRRINQTILENNLPEEIVLEPFPEDDDPDCE